MDDLHARARYAEALIFNELYSETLEFIHPLYIKYHEVGFGVNEIIKSLYGLGKTEDDFQWISRPKIIKLDENLIESCLNFLGKKRGSTPCWNIYDYFLMNSDYLDFDQKELGLFLLHQNDKFEVFGDENDAYDLEFKKKRNDANTAST